ncbi:hypothetical protein [Halobaculum litoreum]|uniref:CbaC protein n=1 Tax=Halobaculum litoreum TaxID=3031998 RepID=A0ABD5XR62_9EURY|nr:hypothetical protein [Halobaculum sp. DT92]
MTHDEPTDDPGGANSTRSTDSASSPPTERTERFWLIATGLLLVTMPAFTLVVAYAVLLATQSVLVGNITTVELVELYLIELLAFALFGYLLYRLTEFSSRRHARVEQLRSGKDATESDRGTETGTE